MFLKVRPFMATCAKSWMGFNRCTVYTNKMPLFNTAFFSTSDKEPDWDKLDYEGMKNMTDKYMRNKRYDNIMDAWKRPFLKKQRKKAAKLERDALKTPAQPEPQQLVVHDASKPIMYPQDPYGIFAIIEIHGKQFKVTKDVTVMLEKIPFEVGDRLVIDQVLMVDTKDYTSIGRPFVETARVYATVEEISRTKKIIVFKKRRRKDYQKNQGHSKTVYVIRVDNIVHSLGEQEILEEQVTHLKTI